MSEQAMPTRDVLAGCVQALSEVSVRLQSLIDRFEGRRVELDRLKEALARIETPVGRRTFPPGGIGEYVAAGHRRHGA